MLRYWYNRSHHRKSGQESYWCGDVCRSRYVLFCQIHTYLVRDAQENAIQNGITNVEYIVGKAEDVLATRLKQITGSNTPCIAIIDPPRAGLRILTSFQQAHPYRLQNRARYPWM